MGQKYPSKLRVPLSWALEVEELTEEEDDELWTTDVEELVLEEVLGADEDELEEVIDELEVEAAVEELLLVWLVEVVELVDFVLDKP